MIVTDEPIFRDAGDAVHVATDGRPHGLAEAIETVLADRPYRDELARRAEQRSRRFLWDRVAAEHRQIYAAAARAGRARRWEAERRAVEGEGMGLLGLPLVGS